MASSLQNPYLFNSSSLFSWIVISEPEEGDEASLFEGVDVDFSQGFSSEIFAECNT